MASGIAAFVMIALFGAFSSGFNTIRLSQEEVRGDQLLVEQLETLRLYSWSQVTNSSFMPTNFTAYFSGTNGVAYAGTIAVGPPPLTQSYSNLMKQVTVTLTWTSAGVPRTRSMSTLVAQNGIQNFSQ
jgi:hypothetical protein